MSSVHDLDIMRTPGGAVVPRGLKSRVLARIQRGNDDPRLQEHPLLHKEDYKHKCLPGRLHGDKVPYGKRKGASADVSSWSIMTAVGTVWRTLNAWMVVPEGAKYKGLLCIAQSCARQRL